MVRKTISLNTIAHFRGNYIDDNKNPAKERRHLSIEKEGDYLLFMKLTSEKRKELSQVRLIKIEPELVKCLNMVSYPVFNRKVRISLTDLKTTNYQYFHTCSLHLNGCLKTKKFNEVCRVFKEIREDKSTPESEKKIITLKANELKLTKEIPLMSRINGRDCAKLRNLCFLCLTFLFTTFFFASL